MLLLMDMLTDRYLLITNMFTVIYFILITNMLTDIDYDMLPDIDCK